MARTSPEQFVSAGGEERLSQRIKLPGTPRVLDPTRVREHRHAYERPALLVSLLIIALLVLAGIWRQDFLLLAAIATVWLTMTRLAIQAATAYTLRGAEITATQFPEIYTVLDQISRAFNAPPTRAFVIRESRAQVHAYGLGAPYVIVFHSALLDSLEPDELRFVVGQQLGRIVYGHTRTIVLLGGEEETLPALFAQLTWLRDLFFAWYKRVALLSADRAGALACGDLEVAARTLIKLSVGNRQFQEMRGDDLVDQIYRVNEGLSRVQAAVIWATSTVPPQLRRLQELVIWGGTPKDRAALAEAAAAPGPPPEGSGGKQEDHEPER